jgi:uncharacterized protein DUF3486
MGRRSKTFVNLPEHIRVELFRRAAKAGLADYRALEEWLARAGYEVGKSSIQRALSPFERELQLLRRAQFLREASGAALELSAAIQAIALNDLSWTLGKLLGRAK